MYVRLENVSIRYRSGNLRDMGVRGLVRTLLKKHPHEYFWAVRGVSMTVQNGDMLGIIGANGSGKSTLLKAVSGIIEPTRGHITRIGKVTALLELVSGFDAELSVRENTYLRGAMLGYTRKYLEDKYDEIIAFSELESFQDWPFSQLSSGMKARLALSIASLLEPEILILDEVLAVGDMAFRRKSEQRIREVIANGAVTIMVSHSISQVRNMCNQALWLHKGAPVEYSNDVDGICDRYEAFQNGTLSIEGHKVGASADGA